MSATKRATIEFNPQVHDALRVKAEETERTISDLVDEAVRLSFAEDAEDLAALDERRQEPDRPFDEVIRDLRRRGSI
jgi:hypothetical protein